MGDGSVQSVADELRAEGRAAYYLGPEASGLALTDVTRVTENGPEFQVWASYGTCHPAMFDDGGCMDPLSVSTLDWRPDVTGVSCQRLEPQLGVPAGLVMGELTLFTDRVQVSVVHVDDLADYDGHRGLALLERPARHRGVATGRHAPAARPRGRHLGRRVLRHGARSECRAPHGGAAGNDVRRARLSGHGIARFPCSPRVLASAPGAHCWGGLVPRSQRAGG